MDSLLALKAAVSEDPKGFQLLDGPHGKPVSLENASVLLVGGSEYNLDQKTAFKSANDDLGYITLKTVVNCWISREMSVPQYIAHSDELHIPNLKFMERTDLVEWLEGSSSTSEYIKPVDESGDAKMDNGDEASAADADSAASGFPTSGITVPTLSAASLPGARGTLVDHSSVLHGSKKTDFSNVIKLSHQYLAAAGKKREPHRSSGSSSSGGGSGLNNKLPPLRPSRGKDPIILLSPSPSSFLNMANVQEFLENGVFNPVLKSATSPNLLRISRKSNLLGPRVKFVVVDSIDRFKPEYWDRVVAVFVTGQPWQLRGYKWKDPNQLFQNVLGFSLIFKNDPIPDTLRQWNVTIETVDRTARFRDREVMERIWERIEKYMISRGWPVHGVV